MTKKLSFAITIFLLILTQTATATMYRSRHITSSDGLPTNSITSIVQDRNGYVWIGTTNGLCRYDGYSVLHFSSLSNNLKDKTDQYIAKMKLDDKHNVLNIQTANFSEASYDINSSKFLYYKDGAQSKKPKKYLNGKGIITECNYGNRRFVFTEDNVGHIIEGKKHRAVAMPPIIGQIKYAVSCFVWQNKWYILAKNGTFAMDLKTKSYSHPKELNIADGSLQGDAGGYLFLADYSGRIWILTPNGKIIEKMMIPNVQYTNNKRHKVFVTQDNSGTFFIATYGNGLFTYRPQTGIWQHFTAEDSDPMILSNYLMCIMRDRSGNIWVGSENDGISCLLSVGDLTATYVYPESGHHGDKANTITSINHEGKSKYSIATTNNRIYIYDAATGKIESGKTTNGTIHNMFTDRNGNKYICTLGNGLFINGERFSSDNKDKYMPSDRIYGLAQDKYGRLWIATNKNGLFIARYSNGKLDILEHFLTDDLNSACIHDILSDKGGTLMLATYNGLYTIDTNEKRINKKQFKHYSAASGSLPGNELLCMHYSQRHNLLYVGVLGHGLCICKKDKNGNLRVINEINTHHGLASNIINSISEDRYGNIWAGTEDGLTCIRNVKEKLQTYRFSSTRASNAFSENCSLTTDDGQILIGTRYGLLVMTPPAKTNANTSAKPYITDISINGTSIYDIHSGIHMDGEEGLSLNHKQNTLTISFSDFDYANTESTLYQYYLEGHDPSWRQPTSDNRVQYGDLPPGKYIFHLRSVNGNSGETSLSITVHQPWYNTWMAWLMYIAFISIATYYIYRNWRNNLEIKQKIEMEKQITEFRINFFTHTTHEFRTPLAIIKGAADTIVNTRDNRPPKSATDTLQRGINRLLRLVNQLMEFRKVNTDNIKLNVEDADIIAFVRRIYNDFISVASQKEINISFIPFARSHVMTFDKHIVETIVYNLLSNAVKYTPVKGQVELRIHMDGALKMMFQDSGPGIAKEQTGQLFQPFMHGYVSQGGMGIGLFMAHKMALAHHGNLTYEYTGNGSLFTVTLPAEANVYVAEDYKMDKAIATDQDETEHANSIIQEMQPQALNSHTVSIIEDDPDMMQQIRTAIGTYFQTDCYMNGLDGYNGVTAKHPDLIISDVMLPDMDGYEIVKKIKSDAELSHTPVIMLTGLDDERHQIKGYAAGADDYMIKPCNFNILIARVTQLIEWNINRSTQSAQQTLTENTSPIIKDKADKVFRERIEMIVGQHISEEEFNVDQLAEMMYMGRTKFFGRMKEVIGMSPNKYLQTARMKMAADLLAECKYNVTEVCYRVGIQDISYFNKLFKSFYGVSPSKYGKA